MGRKPGKRKGRIIANNRIMKVRPIDDELSMAIVDNDLEEVKRLIEQGADPGHIDEGGVVPLSRAVCNRHTEIVRYLLEEIGVSPLDSGWAIPIIDVATMVNENEIIDLLIKHGAPKPKWM